MSGRLSRRVFLAGLSAAGGAVLAGCNKDLYVPPHFGGLLDLSDALMMSVQRMLLSEQSMAREYSREDLSPTFPVEGTSLPFDVGYQAAMDNGFADWRLPVEGLVARPLSLSVADLKAMPSRTQITSHSCESGWTAIGEWTGVPLAHVLELAGLDRRARYIAFDCVDGWYDYLDLFDAFHAQTILAYGMNGSDLPTAHGAPVRLRVERQLGYKSLKFLERIRVVDEPERIDYGDAPRLFHYAWYAGI